ncbi:MAG: methyltransferase [Gammaproteobacteria bacterium]|nr:MAG: methyltransferase [Gammaproteobacteria bacterium]
MKVAGRTSWLVTGLALGAGFSGALHWQSLRRDSLRRFPQRSGPPEEQARDASRKPGEVLSFVGIEAGMTVLELFAGGGWYTEAISAAVGPEGMVYAQNPERFRERVAEAAAARASRLGNVEVIYTVGTDMFAPSDIGLPEQADVAFTALNLHDYANRGDETGLAFLRGIYDSVVPGGTLGVVDHVGVAGQDNAELHRMEASKARKLLTAVGFVVEAESLILTNPADDHSLGIRDPSIRFQHGSNANTGA